MSNAYLFLAAAIVAEVIGTSALKLSAGMTNLAWTAVVVASYGVAFWLMSLTMKTLPVGFVYAVWAGVGIVLIKAIGVVFFDEALSLRSVVGILFIAVGVVLLQLEKSTA